jgi:hypothetical protein
VMPGQERELARLMELLESQRVERWHATYNAAVTGIITRAAEYGWGPSNVKRSATGHANAMHGPLVLVVKKSSTEKEKR